MNFTSVHRPTDPDASPAIKKAYQKWAQLKHSAKTKGHSLPAEWTEQTWQHPFDRFLADVGFPPTMTCSLRKKNMDLPYSASNLRWVDSNQAATPTVVKETQQVKMADDFHRAAQYVAKLCRMYDQGTATNTGNIVRAVLHNAIMSEFCPENYHHNMIYDFIRYGTADLSRPTDADYERRAKEDPAFGYYGSSAREAGGRGRWVRDALTQNNVGRDPDTGENHNLPNTVSIMAMNMKQWENVKEHCPALKDLVRAANVALDPEVDDVPPPFKAMPIPVPTRDNIAQCNIVLKKFRERYGAMSKDVCEPLGVIFGKHAEEDNDRRKRFHGKKKLFVQGADTFGGTLNEDLSDYDTHADAFYRMWDGADAEDIAEAKQDTELWAFMAKDKYGPDVMGPTLEYEQAKRATQGVVNRIREANDAGGDTSTLTLELELSRDKQKALKAKRNEAREDQYNFVMVWDRILRDMNAALFLFEREVDMLNVTLEREAEAKREVEEDAKRKAEIAELSAENDRMLAGEE